MSLGRAACAAVMTLALGVGAVASSAAVADDDGDGKPSWKRKGDDYRKAPSADRIAADRLGDAEREVDIQSLAVFNRKKLDFVGLAITGRDFRIPATRSVEVYLAERAHDKPQYRLVATNDGQGEGVRELRLYRVKGWTTSGETRAPCTNLRVEFDIANQSQIRVAVPRSCIGGFRKGISANASVWGGSLPLDEKSDPSQRTDSVPGKELLTRRAR